MNDEWVIGGAGVTSISGAGAVAPGPRCLRGSLNHDYCCILQFKQQPRSPIEVIRYPFPELLWSTDITVWVSSATGQLQVVQGKVAVWQRKFVPVPLLWRNTHCTAHILCQRGGLEVILLIVKPRDEYFSLMFLTWPHNVWSWSKSSFCAWVSLLPKWGARTKQKHLINICITCCVKSWMLIFHFLLF